MISRMKRHMVIFATLASLVPPALGEARGKRVVSPDALAAPAAVERGSVAASAVTNLLVEKGLITPEEQKKLTHSVETPSVDEKTMREIFRGEPYRGE